MQKYKDQLKELAVFIREKKYDPKLSDYLMETALQYQFEIASECKDKESIEFLKEVVKDAEFTYEDKNVRSLVAMMAYDIREKSHNGVRLDKVFLPANLYNQLIEELGITQEAVCKILGATLVKVDLPDNEVIGVCKPKFKFAPIEQLILRGVIKTENKGVKMASQISYITVASGTTSNINPSKRATIATSSNSFQHLNEFNTDLGVRDSFPSGVFPVSTDVYWNGTGPSGY